MFFQLVWISIASCIKPTAGVTKELLLLKKLILEKWVSEALALGFKFLELHKALLQQQITTGY